MTVPIVPQQSSDSTSTTRWCELCCREEACHCPAMKSWCSICVPPISVAAQNILAHEISLPEESYQPVTGLTPAGVAVASAWRRRQTLKAVS